MKPARKAVILAVAVLNSAMLGIAAGALWMLPTAFLHGRQGWIALPIGALLGGAIARWVRPHRHGPALAAGATLLAATYVSLMNAAATLASSMGAGITETIHTAGGSMLLALAWLAMTPVQGLWLFGGTLLAAAIAWRAGPR